MRESINLALEDKIQKSEDFTTLALLSTEIRGETLFRAAYSKQNSSVFSDTQRHEHMALAEKFKPRVEIEEEYSSLFVQEVSKTKTNEENMNFNITANPSSF